MFLDVLKCYLKYEQNIILFFPCFLCETGEDQLADEAATGSRADPPVIHQHGLIIYEFFSVGNVHNNKKDVFSFSDVLLYSAKVFLFIFHFIFLIAFTIFEISHMGVPFHHFCAQPLICHSILVVAVLYTPFFLFTLLKLKCIDQDIGNIRGYCYFFNPSDATQSLSNTLPSGATQLSAPLWILLKASFMNWLQENHAICDLALICFFLVTFRDEHNSLVVANRKKKVHLQLELLIDFPLILQEIEEEQAE
ncbi:hypothetical protein ACJX0J_005775 [Zea mays]